MNEHELKYMLDGAGYDACIKALCDKCKECGTERLIINYYYDTAARALHKEGITLRIRQIGDRLQGQIKRHDKGASADSNESYFEVSELPSAIRFEGRKAKLLGALVNKRTVFKADGMEFDLDAVSYLGNSDYELEIEFAEGKEAEAHAAAISLGVAFLPKRGGKFSRFLKALARIEDSVLDAGTVSGEGDEL